MGEASASPIFFWDCPSHDYESTGPTLTSCRWGAASTLAPESSRDLETPLGG